MNKIVSQVDEYGFFVCGAIADESPLEPGVFLMPAGCIDKAPPKVIEPGKRYRQWGTGWRGEDIPTPVQEPMTFAGGVDRRGLIVEELTEIDRQSIRPARVIAMALAAGEEIPEVEAKKLQALEDQAGKLRAEMKALETEID